MSFSERLNSIVEVDRYLGVIEKVYSNARAKRPHVAMAMTHRRFRKIRQISIRETLSSCCADGITRNIFSSDRFARGSF